MEFHYINPKNEIYGYSANDNIQVTASCKAQLLADCHDEPLCNFRTEACKSQMLNQKKQTSTTASGMYVDMRNIHLLHTIHMISLAGGCIVLSIFGVSHYFM